MRLAFILMVIACLLMTAPAFAQEVISDTCNSGGCNGGLMDTIFEFFDNFSWPWIV